MILAAIAMHMRIMAILLLLCGCQTFKRQCSGISRKSATVMVVLMLSATQCLEELH
jgi:type III secretory pathway lipoprotein EscJ